MNANAASEMAKNILTEVESRMSAYLDDLRILTGMDSYSYDPEDVNRVVDWLEARLSGMGFTVKRHPQEKYGDNLVAVRKGQGRGKITLVGHSDTVFAAGTTAQRPMKIEGDKILAPGSYDMKGGLLTGIYAVEALDKLNLRDYGEVTFLIVSDEEIDARTSVPLMLDTMRGQDAVLTLEGARSNGDIVTARKGSAWFSVTAFGRAAHAGVEPEKGRNAIMGLIRRLDRVVALEDLDRGNTVNVGTIEGGTLPNVVPERARVGINARSFFPEEIDAIISGIQEIFREPDANGVRFEVEHIVSSPPMPFTPQIERLETLAQIAAAELGFMVRGARTGGAADSAFAAKVGVPSLDGLGPIGGLDHGPDEYMLLSSIAPRTSLLARLMILIAEDC